LAAALSRNYSRRAVVSGQWSVVRKISLAVVGVAEGY
jgi:hypothetical protein